MHLQIDNVVSLPVSPAPELPTKKVLQVNQVAKVCKFINQMNGLTFVLGIHLFSFLREDERIDPILMSTH